MSLALISLRSTVFARPGEEAQIASKSLEMKAIRAMGTVYWLGALICLPPDEIMED